MTALLTEPTLATCRHEARSVVDHMVHRVESAVMEEFPFPHFLVSELFPSDFYDALLRALPSPEAYGLVHPTRHQWRDGKPSRTRFGLTDADLARLPERQKAIWRIARDALGSPELKRAVYRKLAPGLRYRFGRRADDLEALPGFPLPELFRETTGYSIAPHPDTRRKVVTMQVALPRDESQWDLGTRFYRLSLKPSAWLRRPYGFEIAKRAPFLPNTAYAFVVLNSARRRSWHGRETLRENCGVRNSILNLYYADAEHGNPDLVPRFAPSRP